MSKWNVLYSGIDPDQTWASYKDIERVIALQDGVLCEPFATMRPLIVVQGGKSDDGD